MKTIDIFELSRTRGEIEGDLALADLPGLSETLEGAQKSAAVHFHAKGTAGRDDLPGAALEIHAKIQTMCSRCGKPVEVTVDKTVPFLFTRSEEQADAMDISEDGEFEVVVGSTKFDVAAWVQEELILSLPAFPQHARCEVDEAELEAADENFQERENPFAVLAGLKKH